jgi:hypothetical protein
MCFSGLPALTLLKRKDLLWFEWNVLLRMVFHMPINIVIFFISYCKIPACTPEYDLKVPSCLHPWVWSQNTLLPSPLSMISKCPPACTPEYDLKVPSCLHPLSMISKHPSACTPEYDLQVPSCLHLWVWSQSTLLPAPLSMVSKYPPDCPPEYDLKVPSCLHPWVWSQSTFLPAPLSTMRMVPSKLRISIKTFFRMQSTVQRTLPYGSSMFLLTPA